MAKNKKLIVIYPSGRTDYIRAGGDRTFIEVKERLQKLIDSGHVKSISTPTTKIDKSQKYRLVRPENISKN